MKSGISLVFGEDGSARTELKAETGHTISCMGISCDKVKFEEHELGFIQVLCTAADDISVFSLTRCPLEKWERFMAPMYGDDL